MVMAGGEVGGLTHQAFFCSSESVYVTRLTSFIETAVACDEPVAAAVPGMHLAWLRAAVPASSAGRVRWIDMAAAGANPGRILPDAFGPSALLVGDRPGR